MSKNTKEILTIEAFLTTPQTSNNQNESTPQEEFQLKIIDEVFSKIDIELKTDLNTTQINAITKGQLFGKHFGCQLMLDLCQNIMILSVSKDRKSRKEFTEISKSMQNPQDDEILTPKTRLFGESH